MYLFQARQTKVHPGNFVHLIIQKVVNLVCHGTKVVANLQRKRIEVMHECFEPSKSVETGRGLIEDVIFGQVSKLNRLNFRGFYTVILEENDDPVSVATVRVYDNKVAEMPLVATRFRHRRRGMCRVLVDELGKNLVKLGVEKLVLPAVPTTLETWTNNFGFSCMPDDEKDQSFCNIVY